VKLINPPELAPARGFAHVAIAGGWVFLGGQISSDATGAVLHPGDLPAQFAQAIRNVATALAAAGCRPADVVKLTYFVTDVVAYRNALKPIGVVYREVFGHHYPATSLFEVKGLFEAEAMIEVEAIALVPDDGATVRD
jgi:enamine deaminase RidA (YjgF/YER057c/UK114 family)